MYDSGMWGGDSLEDANHGRAGSGWAREKSGEASSRERKAGNLLSMPYRKEIIRSNMIEMEE
jgi:hypothetical protein